MPEPEQTTDGAEQQTGVADVIAPDTQTDERTDAAPQFDPAVLSRAQSLGFDQGEIDALGPANLSMVLRATDRASTAGVPQQQQQQQVGAGQQQQQIDPMRFAAALDLNKDDVDENVINALNGINSHYASQSVQMMAAIGELVNRMTGMNDTVGRMTFNEHVNGLGEDWHSVLGPPNARNAKELDRLREHVGAMQLLGTADYGEAFQRALGSLYFSRLAEMERKALNGRVQRGAQRTSERPRSREEEPAQNGREKATQRIRSAQMAEMGKAP